MKTTQTINWSTLNPSGPMRISSTSAASLCARYDTAWSAIELAEEEKRRKEEEGEEAAFGDGGPLFKPPKGEAGRSGNGRRRMFGGRIETAESAAAERVGVQRSEEGKRRDRIPRRLRLDNISSKLITYFSKYPSTFNPYLFFCFRVTW